MESRRFSNLTSAFCKKKSKVLAWIQTHRQETHDEQRGKEGATYLSRVGKWLLGRLLLDMHIKMHLILQ